jgi:hypothetical protein
MDGLLVQAHGFVRRPRCPPAGAKTRDMPARIVDYTPTEDDCGGLFDDKSRAKRVYATKKP